MSMADENDEKVVRGEVEEPEDNDEVGSSAELEKKKQITNEYNVEGNTAQKQFFVQNLNMVYKQMPREAAADKSPKKYDLRQPEECSEFIEKYKNSDYVAVAIILCTFEAVSLGDLSNLQEELLKYLPKVERSGDEGEIEQDIRRNPYLSLNTLLSVIGGKRFIAVEGQTCTGLGENSKQALVNLMEQFPSLRRPIISWLIHVNEVYKYNTTFDAYQIATAFARVISLDVADAEMRIFPRLYSEPKNAGLLGILMYKLYGDALIQESVQTIILQWIKSESTWLWKPVCLVYSYLKQDGRIDISFESALGRVISKRFGRFKGNDLAFISLILVQSEAFRTMLAKVIHDTYLKANAREGRITVAVQYIKLVRSCYYLVNRACMELPLVACDTKQQQDFLAPLVEQVMSEYRLRKQLYVILEAYMKEISDYNCSDGTINHVAAYFYNIASSDFDFQQDVLYFIQNCRCRASQKIYERLKKAYGRK